MGLQKLKIDPNRSPRSEHEFGNVKIYDNMNKNDQNHQNHDDDVYHQTPDQPHQRMLLIIIIITLSTNAC